VEIASKYDDGCREPQGGNSSTISKGKEGHIVDNCSATEHETNEDCRINMNVAISKKSLGVTTSSKTDDVEKQRIQQGPDTTDDDG
jgi:hypothetical protein